MRGKISHIEINVRDLERSKNFWRWLLEELDYSAYQIWDKGISFILDNTYIVFVQTREKYLGLPYNRCGIGLNHLAFFVEGKESVDELTKRLEEKGIKILYEDRHPYAGGENHYAVFFEDPDRIKVEIVAI